MIGLGPGHPSRVRTFYQENVWLPESLYPLLILLRIISVSSPDSEWGGIFLISDLTIF
jgi:hypothetical protein